MNSLWNQIDSCPAWVFYSVVGLGFVLSSATTALRILTMRLMRRRS